MASKKQPLEISPATRVTLEIAGGNKPVVLEGTLTHVERGTAYVRLPADAVLGGKMVDQPAKVTLLDPKQTSSFEAALNGPDEKGFLTFTPPSDARFINRRQAFRLDVKMPLTLTVGSSRSTHDGSMVDISAGGLRVRGVALLPIGEVVGVHFALDGEPFEAQAKVVRDASVEVREREYVLQFVDLTASLEAKVVRFLHKQQALQRRPKNPRSP